MTEPFPPAISALPTLRATVARWRAAGETVALVPTMGALHEGHLALVDEARRLARRVVVSIFVNPTQFGPSEDFSRYPRGLASDLAALARVEADAAWTPDVGTMYPAGFATRIEVAGLTEGLCGPLRPGHFSGVATVVTKLLNQVGPDVALFGQKDFQQLRVIQRAVADLDLPVTIHGVPTIREADGLALSSRNRYLTEDERRTAPALHGTLAAIAAAIREGSPVAGPVTDGAAHLAQVGFTVQYLTVCDAETLAPVERVTGPARVFVAAILGRTRLIDNIPVGGSDRP